MEETNAREWRRYLIEKWKGQMIRAWQAGYMQEQCLLKQLKPSTYIYDYLSNIHVAVGTWMHVQTVCSCLPPCPHTAGSTVVPKTMDWERLKCHYQVPYHPPPNPTPHIPRAAQWTSTTSRGVSPATIPHMTLTKLASIEGEDRHASTGILDAECEVRQRSRWRWCFSKILLQSHEIIKSCGSGNGGSWEGGAGTGGKSKKMQPN